MLRGSKNAPSMAVSYMTNVMDVFDFLSVEDKRKMKALTQKADLKEWIMAWSSVKPNEDELDESSSNTFYAVKRVAVELLLQMRNSSCQERSFSLSASSDHQSKYLSTTFDAVCIKSFAKNQAIFKNHATEEVYKRHWLKNI